MMKMSHFCELKKTLNNIKSVFKIHAVYSQEAQILRVYTLTASCQIYPSDIFYLICTVF